MGIPIKDRGIRWEEAYSDKSAYLKEQYENQVGPGSYFRWEGHDHTTGQDYYAVVTPGFSDKHGFHFFAALRKVPAENGASGKKFKNQAEALSYAYDTWRVPPPKTPIHKTYIANDLEGKPIVLENVHAALETAMTKEAMAYMTSAPFGKVFRRPGPKELPNDLRQAATMNMIMQPGAALGTSKTFQTVDLFDQGPAGAYSPEGNKSTQIMTGLATCQPPSEAVWNSVMSPEGVAIENRLIDVDRDSGAVGITPPQNPNSEVVRFDRIMMLHPTFRVSMERKAAFDDFMSKANLVSQLMPGAKPTKLNESPPSEEDRGNYSAVYSVPVDMLRTIRDGLETNQIASIEKMRWIDDNAAELYNHFLQTGQLKDAASAQKAMQTPVIEILRKQTRGQLMIYDPSGYPLGIKVKKIKRFDQEVAASDTQDAEDTFLIFGPGKIDPLLKSANGDLGLLKKMFAKNQIELTRDMFLDSRTCAPINRHIWSDLPEMDDNGKPILDKNSGQMMLKRSPLIDRNIPMDAPGGKVRVYNPESGRHDIIPLPSDVEPVQNIDGIPVLIRNASYHVLETKQGPDGNPVEEWHAIPSGETRLFDPNSKNKFQNGAVFTTYIKPEKASSRKSDVKDIQGKGHDSLGFFVGSKKTMSDMLFRNSKTPKKAQSVILQKHLPQLYSLVLPDGKQLLFPEDPDKNPNDPAVLHYKNNQPISGYYYIGQRQAASVPYTTKMPTDDNPIHIKRKGKRDDGTFGQLMAPNGQTLPDLLLYPKDVTQKYRGVTYVSNMGIGVEMVKAAMGYDDKQIGKYTDCDISDLHAGDDMAKAVNEMLDAGVKPEELSGPERLYAEIEKKGNDIPYSVLKEFAQVTDDPKYYQSRKGTVYKIVEQKADGTTELANKNYFVTEKKANSFLKWMTDTNPEKYAGKKIFVSPIENADLMVSAFRKKLENPNADPVVTKNLPPFTPKPEDQQPVGTAPVPETTPDGQPIAQQPGELLMPTEEDMRDVQPTTPAPAAQQPAVPEPAAEPAPQFKPPALAPGLVFQPKGPPAPAPQPEGPFKPQPTQSPFRVQLPPKTPTPTKKVPFNASAINRLIKLANKFDEEGQTEQANAIDNLIKVTLQKMKEGN